MLLPRFDYLEPKNLEGALDLLAIHRENAKLLAGGTDLLVRMKKGLLKPKSLISLKSLNELSYIKKEADSIKIGAGTPLADIIASGPVQETHGHSLGPVKKSVPSPYSITEERLGEISFRTTGAIITTSLIFTVPVARPATRMGGKSAMHGKTQTGATPPASQTVQQPSWPWVQNWCWSVKGMKELWILINFTPLTALCPMELTQ